MSARVLLFAAVAVFCALSAPLHAQQVIGTPDDDDAAASVGAVAAGFEVSQVKVERLDFPVEDGLPFAVDVPLGGEDYVLELEPHSMRSASFKLLVKDEHGVHEEVPQEPRTYRGVVFRQDGSEVAGAGAAGSLVNGKFEGVVDLADGVVWFIQPVAKAGLAAAEDEYAIYRGEDTLPSDGRCGVPDDAQGVEIPEDVNAFAQGERGALATGDKVADIAFDADTQFYNLNGSSVANTMFDIENVMNTIEFIYERDVDITYEITTIFVRTCCTADPYTTNNCSSLLDQMVGEWLSDPNLTGIQRDTAHLMTGRNLTDPCLGVAFLGTICSTSNSYGLSQSRWSTNFNNRVVVTAHELGHSWNAAHCDASGCACDIMCSGVGGCCGYGLPNFGAGEQSQIEAFKNTRTCLFPSGGVGVTLADPISLPFFDPFPSTTFDDAKWSYRDGATINATAVAEPSAPNAANLDSDGTGADDQNDMRTNFMLLTGEQAIAVEYYTQHVGAEVGDNLVLEYWSKNGTNLGWATLITITSDGVNQNTFTAHSHALTVGSHPTAFHDEFRLRFRTEGGDDTGDDWFVDDVLVHETGTLVPPLIDSFPATAINTTNWTGIDSATTSTRGLAEPSPDRSVNLNGTIFGGDVLRSAEIDASAIVDLVVTYWYQRTGEEDSPETGDDLIVEYLNAANQWVEFSRHFGSGADMTAYELVSVVLPAGAHHSGFRVRFRVSTYEDQNDDWFVDDVCIGDVGDCNLGPQPCTGAEECDDGIACTVDTCPDGFCAHTGNAALCDDGIACTTNTCSALEGCVFAPVDASCNDGVACTDDSCNPATGCVFTANHANCDDFIGCTVDTCNAVSGCSFVPDDLICDDNLNCTDDSCNPATGCVNADNGLPCGDVQGAVVSEKIDPLAESLGLRVCNVSVVFDSADDNLLSIGFADITTNDPMGFYQNAFGEDTAPNQAFCAIIPELCLDSFVTIGVKVDDGTDSSTPDPDWNSTLFNTAGATSGGWFNSNPLNTQGHPDENLQVLVAQLTVREGYSITGSMIAYSNNGVQEPVVSFECFASCPADFNNDGLVNASDLATLLGAWGPNPGHPADLNSDGVINANDLALLLGAWGPC